MLKPTLLLALPLLVAAGGATPIQPGRWVSTVTILDMHMPGAPPQVAAMMRGRPTTVSACVTPADAANGPRAALEKSNGRCRYTEFTMTGGRLSTTMVCSGRTGGMTFHSVGSFTLTSLTVDGSGSGANGMTMRTRTVSRRTGPC